MAWPETVAAAFWAGAGRARTNKSKDKSKGEIRGFFAALRMTPREEAVLRMTVLGVLEAERVRNAGATEAVTGSFAALRMTALNLGVFLMRRWLLSLCGGRGGPSRRRLCPESTGRAWGWRRGTC